MDCSDCDMDFIRTEITFVNYVRDRKEAQVHVLVTTQPTAGGGTEYTIFLMGQQEFGGLVDTLEYFSKKTDTQDDIRRGLVKSLKMGLVRYASRTPIAEYLSVSFQQKVEPTAVIDVWNNWVFSVSVNGFFNGERRSKYASLGGSLSASHVTPDWKVKMSLRASYNENKYDVGDDVEDWIFSFSRSQYLNALLVRSLDEHWSVGAIGSAYSSTFSNIDLSVNVLPALEFNVFPYSESTSREFRFLYKLGVGNNKYSEETIYEKTSEIVFTEALSATFVVKQPWGSVTTSLQGSHYFHDLQRNRLDLSCYLSLKLLKGLSLDLFGDISRVHDQVSLPKGGASYEEILLQRKELETQYSYFGTIGLSYTFGSIFSNVVNPRFGSEGSGGYSISISY
jgi:hypothetical protein